MMVEEKLCGNCTGEHKFIDCPYIDWRITKTEYDLNLRNNEIVRMCLKTYKYHGKSCKCGFCDCFEECCGGVGALLKILEKK